MHILYVIINVADQIMYKKIATFYIANEVLRINFAFILRQRNAVPY